MLRDSGNPGSFPLRSATLLAAMASGLAGSPCAKAAPSVHPSWSLINIRPSTFQPEVSGLDFLSDGRLVVAEWGGTRAGCCPGGNVGNRQRLGRVSLLSGVTGNTPNVTIQTFATGLEDPMGLTVAGDTIYVSGGNNIVRLVDADRNGVADRTDTIFTYPGTPASGVDSLHPIKGRSEWMYGLLNRNGTFYVNANSMYNATDVTQINPRRGVHLSVTPGNGIRGNYQILSMGLRHPTGLAFGPGNSLWSADIQGHWLPTNKLINLQAGRYYGFHHTPAESWDNMAESPAAVFLPQTDTLTDISLCPGAPLYIPTGPYAGQFFMGDVSYGGVQRLFIENIQGQYQGAVFVFTGGLESGVWRMAWGPDGMLYLGMLGAANDWTWNGQMYGLQKLRYNNTTTFEMLAVRSRPAGMEIEFSEPVGTSAEQAANYQVQTYYYLPTSSYGGAKQAVTTLTPTSVLVSSDRLRIYLALSGLQPRTGNQQRIVYIRLLNVHPQANAAQNSWTPEAWYTLNALGSGNPFDPTPVVDPEAFRAQLLNQLQWGVEGGNLVVRAPFRGPHTIRVRDLRGSLLTSVSGFGPEVHAFRLSAIHGRFAVVEAEGDGQNLRRTVVLP